MITRSIIQSLINNLIMKTLKKIVKFIVVVAIPIVTLSFYVYNIEQVFSLSTSNIVICHLGILLTFFNAIFYSYHMSNTKIFNRFNASIVPAFGFLIGHHDSGSIQILIACIGIDFNYIGLFRKSTNSNLKKENRF
jgi:hypothetical protein